MSWGILMDNQNEITSSRPLLNEHGHITEEGWARQPHWIYSRETVHAPWFRIKEWDYYYVLSDDLKKGITFTISDLGYAGLMALCWIDLENGTADQVDTITLLPRGRITSEDSSHLFFEDNKLSLHFHTEGKSRRLIFSAPGFTESGNERGLSGEIHLDQAADLESLNIATSWAENRRRFYYNRKINCLAASGSVTVGRNVYNFSPESSYGGLDWGRGAWTYKNRWFWSSASGRLNGESFGFNLGYGFSDRTTASENTLFFRNEAHKLGDVSFRYHMDDYMAPWLLADEDGRLNLRFIPIVDRSSSVNLLLIRSVQHQVFGRFSGEVILDDGTVLILENFLGFAEDVLNHW